LATLLFNQPQKFKERVGAQCPRCNSTHELILENNWIVCANCNLIKN